MTFVFQGNTIKAKKILEKAQLFGAEPRETIDRALQNLQDGCHELISKDVRYFGGQCFHVMDVHFIFVIKFKSNFNEN